MAHRLGGAAGLNEGRLAARAPQADRTNSGVLRDDDLEVFARDDRRPVLCDITVIDQRPDISCETGLTACIERGEGLQHRPLVGTENFEPVLWRAVAKREGAAFRTDGAQSPEQMVEVFAVAP
jgi:hypothetical protein